MRSSPGEHAGQLEVLQEQLDETLRGKVGDVLRSCPKQAISLQD